MSDKRDVLISKQLSGILRHKATALNIAIDSKGYVLVDDLLKHGRLRSFKTTFEDIERIVKENAKQRFTMEKRDGDGLYYICANQGHSITTVGDQELEFLTPETFPSKEVFHKTTFNTLDAIFASGGLSKMKRNHIHFKEAGNNSVAGVKEYSNTVIYVDVQKAMSDGIEFYRSKNDVILSKGVGETGILPTEYFTRIIDLKRNQEIPFRNRIK
ncbi:uncharacterized protein KQ657_005001 [Scheffersomyces spartinae]|uniref:2'-phosphotransferase n=1 Tax=Scheffersomyces spartinae TaxID=45513 RepID=A0A9P7VBG4_9ASCO|nr:uncharacterized protein KQ657_005001 [Scheffersomyces spartinae]KAG7194274.1 hypothetical protein KQ657_005001 [Scheffersomyces spartinae]